MFKKLKDEIEEAKYCPNCKKKVVWEIVPINREDIKQMIKDAWSFKFILPTNYPKSAKRQVRCKECGFVKTIPS